VLHIMTLFCCNCYLSEAQFDLYNFSQELPGNFEDGENSFYLYVSELLLSTINDGNHGLELGRLSCRV
jgi:hypothetical protein